ncbi:hypothetical protein [Acidocella sp. C78]|uniref:hypothetical protein n=1 Tax=Acidocella sp. C78 TaxID=1671486 RepID=UPI00191BAFEB|nr:hypothetical protein [Acidocella sp. C78]
MRTRTIAMTALAVMVGIAPVAAQATPASSAQRQGATVQHLSHAGGRSAFTHQLKSIQRLESRN